MKAMKLTGTLVVALALTFGATGCKKKPTGLTPIPGTGRQVTDAGPKDIDSGGSIGTRGDNAIGGGPLPPELNDPDKFNENRTALAQYTVHFDYDSSVIKSSDKANITAVAAYLKDNPGVFLRVEGNCDERGTEEYNRSLGQRRALAGREAIVGEGVDGSRVTAVSYGKDRPVATGNDEAAYRQNRRDEFVVLTPK